VVLWSRVDTVNGLGKKIIEDDVYRALYTRAGRKELLREFLAELGIKYDPNSNLPYRDDT